MQTINSEAYTLDSTQTELHPLLDPAHLRIKTPMVEQLGSQVSRWLWAGLPGGYLVGDPRIGKTTATELLKNQFKTRSGETIPAHTLTISKRDKRTIASIYRNLCLAVGDTPSLRATADDMAAHVVYFLTDKAIANRSRNVILFVDEFQRLEVFQLAVFSELYDKCSALGVSLSVIFVGNLSESAHLIKAIQEPENQHIRGRFFNHCAEYSGIRTRGQLNKCLAQFEAQIGPGLDQVDLVVNKNVSGPFSANWSLLDISDCIWDVYQKNFQKPLGLKSWGMQYFIYAMCIFCLDYLPLYGVDSDIKSMIYESIEASGISPSAVILL